VGVDLDTVQDQRAHLVRTTTRQALDRLRTLRRRKESYVGPWLPEPLLTAPDVAEDVELADSVSMAMLLVLETLTPTERAVFVLREVFDLRYDEIAEAVEVSSTASLRCGSTTASSPASTTCAIPRSCHVSSGRPLSAAESERLRRPPCQTGRRPTTAVVSGFRRSLLRALGGNPRACSGARRILSSERRGS
jgi:Sigma-70, region 4